MKKFLFVLAASLVFIIGCKKDDDNGDTPDNACKISNVQYYDSGQVVQSGTYTYTGNQITKLQFNNYNFTFTYAGNNISKRNYFFSAGASPENYDTIIYNSDNTISKIETFTQSNTGTSYSSVLRIEFVYAGGKLSKTRYLDISGGATDVFMENTFTYTGNNITSLSFVNFADTTQGTVNYTYDTNSNHFKKQNSQAYLVDFLFNPILLDEQGSLLPLAFSENNVTGISNTQIGYVSDDKNNLKDITIAGDLFARYSYQCQ
jgi:hypothetical protein